VRHLKNLGFRVPLAIVNKAHQANQLYPFAISLRESVRTYECTLDKVRFSRINIVHYFLLPICLKYILYVFFKHFIYIMFYNLFFN